MSESKYSPAEWQRWREGLDRKVLFTQKPGNLRQCKLCGNRYPLSGKYFLEVPAAGPVSLYGFIYEGLMFVCRECAEGWGPDFKDDVNGLFRRAKANVASGQFKPLKPVSKGDR